MAQLQRPRPRGARSRHYNNPCRIFVGNISYRIKEPELKDFFSDFGPVMSCEVVRDHIKGWSRGIAFVTFKEAESAQLALDAPEEKLVLEGRIMHTSKPKKPKRQKATQIVNGEEDIHETEEQLGGPKKEPSLHPDVDIRGVELSDDVLHIVFSYLELKDRIRIERVCRQWYRVAKQWWKSAKSLHFQSTFRKFKNDLTDDILHSILKRGCHELRSLDLSASPNRLTNYSLELIGMYCPNLERLDLSGVNATQISFKQLSISCLRLKWLRAHGTHYIGEKCLWWAMHNCNELEYLDLSKNKRISGQCFYVAGDRLHTVLLSESSVTDAGLILLTQHSSRLHCLDVSQCDQLSGGSIRSIAENCHLLSELYLTGPSAKVKTSDLISLGNLKELEILKLSKQIACKDEVLSSIARNCQKLRVLFCEACYDITDQGLKSLTACEQLKHLNISYCHHISDEGLMRLSGKGKLEHLIMKACQAISDSALCCLAENCLQLKELDISGCLNVTNKTLYAFQESLLHMRDPADEQSRPSQFSIIVGGTIIERIVAVQFAADTGANLSLHDLSVRNLSADYDHFLDFSEECWEDDNQPCFFAEPEKLAESKLEFMEREAELMVGDHGSSHYTEKAEDYLLADDPALFSDEFSDPEDWGLLDQ